MGHGVSMIAGLVLALAAGLLARSAFSFGRPSVVVALLAGLAGMVAGAPVAHAISGEHEFHAFRPESFLSALVGAVVILWVYRRLRQGAHRGAPRIFF